MKSTRMLRFASFAAVAAVTAISVSGVLAVRKVFDRPGESTLRFVPADSIVAASIDLVPSPGQVMAFKSIDDALDKGDMHQVVEKGILSMVEHSPIASEIEPYLKRSGAVAAFRLKDEVTGVMMIALSDPGVVSTFLKTKGKPQFFRGMRYYKLPQGGSSAMMVIDDTLLIASDGPSLAHVNAVATGASPAINTVAAAMTARGRLANDANIQVLVSPDVVDSGKNRIPMKTWAAVGTAVRDNGIEITSSGQPDTAVEPTLAKFMSVVPLRKDLFNSLPSGAYGVWSQSEPAKLADGARDTVNKHADEKATADLEKGMKEGIGLSMDDDLMPALKGTTTFAAYPRADEVAGIDGLVIMDDANGADPAAAMRKLMKFAAEHAKDEKHASPLFTETAMDGGTRYQLDAQIQKEMFSEPKVVSDDPVRYDKLMGGKTLAVAILGKTVLAATNRDLLNRAIATFRTHQDSLATDPTFREIQPRLDRGSVTLMTMNLARIATGVRNTMNMEKVSKEPRETVNSLLGAFESLNVPLSVTAQTSPDGVMTGTFLIPMNYDKIMDVLMRNMLQKKEVPGPQNR